MLSSVRTAVIGMGVLGNVYAETYRSSPNAELVVVCDLDPGRAKAAGERHGCRYTTDINEIGADGTIDLVAVATPDFAHRDACVAMLRAGKHVMVEKPLATTLGDAQAITDAAKESGVRLMVDFQNRWNPLFIQAKQLIDAGEIGDPVMAYARLSNTTSVPTEFLSWASKSGPEWFLFPHLLDLLCWLFDQRPQSVVAYGTRGILAAQGIDVYDAIQAQVRFEKAFATVETSWILPTTWGSGIDFRFDILGSAGKIDINPSSSGLLLASSERLSTPGVGGIQHAYGTQFGFFKEPILHFLECVRLDRDPIITSEDGIANVRLIEAIRTSLESGGKEVSV